VINTDGTLVTPGDDGPVSTIFRVPPVEVNLEDKRLTCLDSGRFKHLGAIEEGLVVVVIPRGLSIVEGAPISVARLRARALVPGVNRDPDVLLDLR